MITDKMLYSAAKKSSDVYIRYLERDYNPEYQHEFSHGFERKIQRICWRAKHQLLHWTLRRIASFFLVMLIGGIVWLSVDVKARAAFLEWARAIYETYVVYRFEDESVSGTPERECCPTWLPDGYQKAFVDDSQDTVLVAYTNSEGQGLIFRYVADSPSTDWFINTPSTTMKQVYVNELPADLFVSKEPEIASAIVWMTPEHTACYLSAFLNEDELIKIAESVEKNN